ncbi:hypothetical protein [Carboxylicivirga sp. RSCT41]|uniref:hypothetical protein n=1 Tax=Carboxylicivirga agarovorans TaxID=3417570 RepID=UPI003D358739
MFKQAKLTFLIFLLFAIGCDKEEINKTYPEIDLIEISSFIGNSVENFYSKCEDHILSKNVDTHGLEYYIIESMAGNYSLYAETKTLTYENEEADNEIISFSGSLLEPTNKQEAIEHLKSIVEHNFKDDSFLMTLGNPGVVVYKDKEEYYNQIYEKIEKSESPSTVNIFSSYLNNHFHLTIDNHQLSFGIECFMCNLTHDNI